MKLLTLPFTIAWTGFCLLALLTVALYEGARLVCISVAKMDG